MKGNNNIALVNVMFTGKMSMFNDTQYQVLYISIAGITLSSTKKVVVITEGHNLQTEGSHYNH